MHYFMTTSDMDADYPVYLASYNNLLLSFLDRKMLSEDDFYRQSSSRWTRCRSTCGFRFLKPQREKM